VPNNRRSRRPQKCSVCEDQPPPVIEDIDTRMAAGVRNADITRWMRQTGFRPIPTATMLNRHREQRHYMGDRTINESSDNLIATQHRDGLNLMQRVQMNVAHVLLPRLALAPKKINVLEEMQELYAFTKNQTAIEFEIAQNTPEVYEHPITGENLLINPTSPNMLRLIKELRHQLRNIDEVSRNVFQQEDIMPELVTKLMAVIQSQDARFEEMEGYMVQTAELVDAEIDEPEELGVNGS
jgi:hypothetical protein